MSSTTGPPRVRTRDAGITWRSVLLALVLIPINCIWVTVIEVRFYALDGCELPLFVTPVFMLFVLVVLNLGLVRWLPRLALSQSELLATYVMVVISCTIAGHDMWQNLFGAISHPFRFATPENMWEQRFFQYLPDWIGVRNKELLTGFYEGNSMLTPQVWQAWAVPLLAWASLVFVMVATMLCVSIIVRKQWAENERLTYPIVQVPIALTEQFGVPLLKNPTMWAGFTLAGAFAVAAGLHALFPAVPFVNVKQTSLHQFLTGRPWDFMGKADLSFYPFMIGLAYFLPLDLGFSIWFFYLVRLAQQIIAGLLGMPSGGTNPYLPEQGSGGWLALSLIAIWGSKDYLRDVLRQVWSGQTAKDEPLTYRTAVLGFFLGFAFLMWWTARLGVSFGVNLTFWVLFFLLSLAMTRVRAELGSPHEIYFVNPRRIMMSLMGTTGFSAHDLTWFSVGYWFNRCYRCHPQPPQLEAFKMAEGDRMNSRRLVWVILAATLFSLIAASWSNLQVCYTSGAVAKAVGFKKWVGDESFNDLSRWLEIKERANPKAITWMISAFAFTVLCSGMRRRYLEWPFHPAGYPLAVSFAVDYFWCAIFVAWFAKVVVLKMGGMKLYRKGIPFAIGMILGDYVIGSIWAIIGPVFGIVTYKIFI